MKNLILFLCLFLSATVFSQEAYWQDFILDVRIGHAEAATESIIEFYSSIDIPEDVSASLSRIQMKGNDFVGTHILSFVSPSAKSLADFRNSLTGSKWELYVQKIQKHIKSVRSSAGNSMYRKNIDLNQPIGQAWSFKVKDQAAFAGAFVKLMESFEIPGLISMGQFTHGTDNGINMYIYSTYPDLEAAYRFGPDNPKEQEAFAAFQQAISDADYYETFTRVLIKRLN